MKGRERKKSGRLFQRLTRAKIGEKVKLGVDF